MTGEVIQWPSATPETRLDVVARVDGVLAIFKAIDAGELLSALPDCEVARQLHGSALALLAMAEREMWRLREDLRA